MLPVAYAFIFMLVASCFTIIILYGSSLQDPAALMWLISSVFSFITSFVVLEPLKVTAPPGGILQCGTWQLPWWALLFRSLFQLSHVLTVG